jgi:hypothetical protein
VVDGLSRQPFMSLDPPPHVIFVVAGLSEQLGLEKCLSASRADNDARNHHIQKVLS